MKLDRRLALVLAAVGLAMAVWLGATVLLVAATFEPVQREQFHALMEPRLALLGLSWLLALMAVSAVLVTVYRRYASAPARLLEQTRLLLVATEAQQITPRGRVQSGWQDFALQQPCPAAVSGTLERTHSGRWCRDDWHWPLHLRCV